MSRRCSVDRRYHSTETWYADGRRFRPGHVLFRRRPHQVLRHRDVPLPRARLRGARARRRRVAGLADPLCRSRAVVRRGRAPVRRARAGGHRSDRPAAQRAATRMPPVPHEPVLAEIERAAARAGVEARSRCPARSTSARAGVASAARNCDAFPCKIDAKGDAEIRLIRPALRSRNVELRSGVQVERLITDDSGRRIVAAEVVEGGERRTISARACSCSVPARSIPRRCCCARPHARHPRGLANSSDVVGRHYMTHNTTALMAVHPLKRNSTRFPKTLAVHDFYFGERRRRHGRSAACNCSARSASRCCAGRSPSVPKFVRSALAAHSVDWYAQSEDLPHPDSRVTLRPDGAINLHWHRTNLRCAPALGRQVQADPARHRLSDRACQALRHRSRIAPVRHGALRRRPGHVGARPAVQGVGPRQPVCRRRRLLSVVGGGQSRADGRRAGAAGRAASAHRDLQ